MKIVFTPRFRNSYKKLVSKNQTITSEVQSKLLLFEKNQKHPSLKNHTLKGRLSGCRAISLGYDLRAIYEKVKGTIIFYDIGTHDKVYR